MQEKRRQILQTLFVIFLLILVVVGYYCFKMRTPFGIKEIKENVILEKTDGKREVSDLEHRLLLNGEQVPFDKIEGCFYIPQMLGKEEWQGKLSLQDKKTYESILICPVEESKKEAMAKGLCYKICYLNEIDNTYQMLDLIVSGLPIMSISGNEMKLFSANKDDVSIDQAFITCDQRGQTTFYYDKKSYNLKLQDEKLSLLGLREDDDWILNAMYDDMGMIHNQLSYQLWNEIASTETTRGNYTANLEYFELLMEGEYQGVYALTERVDSKQLLLSDKDILYKVKGYPQHEGGNVVELKIPKNATLESDVLKEAILSHFASENEEAFENSLILLDYENALDYSLFCQIAAAADNPIKNSYLIGRQTGEFYKVGEVPWDCNITWGIKHYVFSSEDRAYDADFDSLVVRSLKARNSEKVEADMSERWFYLRENVLSNDNIKSILDENLSLLHTSGAYDRNYQKWPTVTINPGEKDEIVDVAVVDIWSDNNIYEFVDIRLNVLDEFYGEK